MTTFPVPVSAEPNFLPVGGTFGQNAVFHPKTVNALAAGIKAASKLGHKVVSESGPPGYKPATFAKRVDNAMVAKLDAFNSVHATPDGSVMAGAAVTIGQLVSVTKDVGLLLPVPDLPYETVVDALKSGVQSHFSRTMGTLRSHITGGIIVTSGGDIVNVTPATDAAVIDEALSFESESIVASLSFRAIPADKAKEYWLATTSIPFSADLFSALSADLFADVAKSISEKSDIVVHTKAAMYNIPVIMIYVSGMGPHTSDPFLNAVKDALLKATGANANSTAVFKVYMGAIAGPETIATGEMGQRTNGRDTDLLHHTIPASQIGIAIKAVTDFVGETLGVGSDEKLLAPAFSSSTRFSINEQGDLEISAFLFKPIYQNESHKEVILRSQKAFAKSHFSASPNFSTLHGASTPPAIPSSINTREGAIPNFQGNTYMQGDENYADRAHQYATSSYPEEQMTPYMVAYPVDEEDVAAAISYAKMFNPQKNIVGRSGGHQYSGLSSGGDDTIVLCMDYFRKIEADPKQYNILTAGPGVRLTYIADQFMKAGVTVPHGECPLVAAGGHTQSGGYGHLLRSYGLIIDHVRSFRIVIGDGSVHEIVKPGVEGTRTHPSNDDIFFAVLGGGPSSFGIVTAITYEAIKDTDHPYSGGLMATMTYKKSSFTKIMKELQARTVKICNGDTLQADNDMMSSAISFDLKGFQSGEMRPDQPPPEGDAIMDFPWSGFNSAGSNAEDTNPISNAEEDASPTETALSFPSFPSGFILLEMVYGDHNASEERMKSTLESFNNLYQDVKGWRSKLEPSWKTYDGKKTLSFLSDSFVRRYGTGPEGREFPYPYEKRLNGSFVPLTDGFVDGFVEICSKVIRDRKVRLVFQVGLGGGQHANGGKVIGENGPVAITGCSRRECSINIVFDVFYTEGHKEVAKNYQIQMGELMDQHLPEGQSVRLIWGCYGDTDIKNVWQYYYDSPELYSRLQGIKQDVDPTDVFHTRFNVQLPSNQNISS